jgi:protease I
MAKEMEGQRIAVLATDGFEQAELTEPVKALRHSGATVDIVSLKSGEIQGMQHKEKGDRVRVDRTLDEAKAGDYAGLMLPGGVANPDELRTDQRAVRFVHAFADARKPIAAICHGPWTLIEADAVRGKRMTSWPSLKTDLKNAGADWVDQEVVADHGLVTSRKPDDLPAFCARMLEEFGEAQQRTA